MSVVSDVLCRGEAYGLIQRERDRHGRRFVPMWISLTAGGAALFGSDPGGSASMAVLVFDAELVGVRGVGARVAVGAAQHLTALHDAIQEAFGWFDDHVYSFWLNNEFYGGDEFEYTSPDIPTRACVRPTFDRRARPPHRRQARLRLRLRRRLARAPDSPRRDRSDDGYYPRVLHVKGTPPPQYGGPEATDAPPPVTARGGTQLWYPPCLTEKAIYRNPRNRPLSSNFMSASDRTRTGDLRRDRPAL